MPVFQPSAYLRPTTLEEASRVLEQHGETARVIGGGTEIYELAERGLLSDLAALVDLGKLDLGQVRREGDSLEIGASVTLSDLERNDAIRQPALGAILDSLRSIHPVQVKNAATVGGAVCSSISFFDLPVALAALGASVGIRSARGSARRGPLTEFIVDFLSPDLKPGEFVTDVTIQPGDRSTSAFSKFSLTGNDWAIVNCACSLVMEGGSISSASVVFGGISSALVAAHGTEERLRGLAAEPGDQFDVVLGALEDELKEVVSDHRASSGYRKKLARVLLRETLDKALTRERG